MKRKILSMSVAAIVTAITSSSVMAFDTTGTNTAAIDGTIVVQGATTLAAYSGSTVANAPVMSTAPLALSANGRGDALIFPAFKQCQNPTDAECTVAGNFYNWSSEIVVRNTSSSNAIVAKVAFYDGKDSTEVLDFNIYLSADDVTRFTIKDGKVESADGSILKTIPPIIGNGGSDDVTALNFASETNKYTKDLSSNSGYIIVYGMAEATLSTGNDTDTRYHEQHDLLFENYRKELDLCRPTWRVGHQNAMLNGTYIRTAAASAGTYSIAAPNQAISCVGGTDFFGDVTPSLTGSIRLESADGGARDMILPATAISNFTSGNKIIWTEGEIAALQDRRIQGTDDAATPAPVAWAKYNEAGVITDAAAFLVGSTTYTYAKDSKNNLLLVTQPYKRVLVQLGNDNDYWHDLTATNAPFGGYSFYSKFFNEHEEQSTIVTTHSPHDSTNKYLPNELQSMKEFEISAGNNRAGTPFKDDNGFAVVRFTNSGGGITTATATAAANLAAAANPANPNGPVIAGTPSIPTGTTYRIPAIITQMIGTTVGAAKAPQVNWIYSQTN